MAIRAKAEITLSRIVDIQSVTRYYLLQSSTAVSPSTPTSNPPASPWVKTEPTYTSGSTNSLYQVDCTEYTNGFFSYSEVSKSSSYEAAKAAYNKAVAVETRMTTAETRIEENSTAISLCATKTEFSAIGEGNLIVNGFGLNRDNYNFNQWVFDGSDKCDGYPSFSYTGLSVTLQIPYYAIPIDKNKTYEFKMNFKGDPTKKLYLGWDEFDIDGNYINPTYSIGMSGTTTTLAQELKNGDTVVYLTSASEWVSTTYAHQLGLIFWNYKDSTGYQYPAGVYSRNAWTGLYTFDNVDKTNNTITLTSAWTHGTFPAGTLVSQSNSSGHKYFGYANTYYPEDWTEVSWIIGGEQTLYSWQNSKINQAAKYIRFIILHNYGEWTATSTTKISKVGLRDVTLEKTLTDNYYNKTQTDAMVKVESDRITSAVTRISNNEKAVTKAQSAADSAQNDINNLELGGRNLFLGTAIEHSNNNYCIATYGPANFPLTAGTQYTVTICVTPAENVTRYSLYFSMGYSQAAYLPVIGTEKQIISKTFTMSYYSGREPSVNESYGHAQFYRYPNDNTVTDNSTIHWIKIERGNRATDWTPAPEDMATGEELNHAQETADSAQETAASAESLIKQLADNISMLVTDGNGTSLMTQTDDGWVFSTADLQKSVNATSEGLENLVSDLGNTNSAVGVLQQAVDDLGVLTDYIAIGTYEEQPCIELGETDSDFKLRITNTQVVYTEGSTVLAYFTNQSMHIKKAVIEEELQQGGFVWKVRSNGNMGLVWKGVTD